MKQPLKISLIEIMDETPFFIIKKNILFVNIY